MTSTICIDYHAQVRSKIAKDNDSGNVRGQCTGGNLEACSNGQIASMLLTVTKLGDACHTVTVTLNNLDHLNRLMCYHILNLTC